MDKETFQKLWQLQNKSPQKILCHELSQRACFAACTDVSIHLLAFELLQVKTYSSGEVILRQNKRSPVNGHHTPYMTRQTNALMQSALKEREQIDRFGYDSRVSNF